MLRSGIKGEPRRVQAQSSVRAFGALSALAIILILGGRRAAAQAGEPPRIPTLDERWAVLKNEKHLVSLAPANASAEGGVAIQGAAAGVDALHYTLDLRFTSQTKTITGSITGQFQVTSPGLTTLVENLYDNMTVSSVMLGTTPLTFVRGGNLLTITLDRPYASGEIIEVTVAYSGTPQRLGFGSFDWSSHQGIPIISSLSEPTYGPTWWPSVDDPSDKVTADMFYTVEPGLFAVSNGVLAGSVIQPDSYVTYHWRESYPIATYLISVAATNYATWADNYTPLAGGAPMEIRYWVYPESLSNGQITFAVTPSILNIFASIFGEYPFLSEKYALATFPFGGGMEHQTATSLGASLVTGTNAYEWVIAHETAHQWWGDSLTLTDWRDTWLHEGFANYCEALYFERKIGTAYYHSYINSYDPGSFSGPVYDNPSRFGTTVYHKGGWVLHMLRHVMGDAAFFNMLPAYHSQYAYGNVTTPLFQAAAEAQYGQSLSWFFQEWVYGTGRPTYQWGWTVANTGTGYVAHVRIDQTQGGAAYRMPLDVRLVTPAGIADAVVWNDASSHDFAVPVPAPPTSVSLDPDNWVLNSEVIVTLADGDADGVPDTADNCAGVSNPSQANADGDALGDACDPDADNDGVLNASDGGSFAAPAEVAGLAILGTPLLWSDLSAQAGPGTAYDVLRGPAEGLGISGGIGGAACLLPLNPLAGASDAAVPSPGRGFYYLVRGHNACGAGTYGTSSSGSPRFSSSCP